MRICQQALLAAGLSFSLSACATFKHKEKEEVSPEQSALQDRQKAAASAERSLDNFEKNRSNYVTKAEDDLNNLEAKIAALKASAPSDPAGRESHLAVVSTLEQNLGTARSQLQGLQSATPDTWDRQQRDVEQAILTTRAAYDAASARLAH